MEKTPKLTHFRNASFIGFLSNVVTICKKYDTEVLKINNEVADISADVQTLELLFSIARKNGNTEALEDLDARRDSAIQGILEVSEAYLKHFDKTYQEAAKTIEAIFAKYGRRIDKLVYVAQTSATQSLVNDFEKDVNVDTALKKLHLAEWVQELKTANNEFNNVYLNRNKELAEQPDQNIKDVKIPAIEHYKRLIDVLKAFRTINPQGDYDKILKEINELVLKYDVAKR
jgi:hypothetical protein